MREPDFPLDEQSRLASLRALMVLDTPAEARFDRITRIAQRIFNVPIVLISLVDEDRQWFKSKQGLNATQTSRNISFCGHAILGRATFYVPDTLKDGRFFDNPLVTDAPNIRFYAGAPLSVSETSPVGTLCIIDEQPREFSPEELEILRDLADWVQDELHLIKLNEAVMIIKDQQVRLSAIFNNVPDGIITMDVQGIVESMNPAAEAIFEFSSSEVVGEDITMLMPEEQSFLHGQYPGNHLLIGIAKETGVSREAQGKKKSGAVFPVELSICEAMISGQRMFIGIVRDITERKQIEQMKNDFICSVSHELRTPLTSIHGALTLLAGDGVGVLKSQEKSLVEIAARNSERLIRLVNDILDVEKIESGKINLHLEKISFMDLLQQAVEANQAFANIYRISFKFEFQGENLYGMVDADRFIQVITNLLSNAIKFSPIDSEVVVRLIQNATRARIEVIDQGPGIPDQFQDKIFEKFVQADNSDTRKHIGTGLGLCIAKAFVEQLGGQIGFDKEREQGACFFMEFPLA